VLGGGSSFVARAGTTGKKNSEKSLEKASSKEKRRGKMEKGKKEKKAA